VNRVAHRALLAIVLAVTLVACGDGGPADGGASATATSGGMDHSTSVSPAAERPSTAATLRIVEPKDGDVVDGTVDVRLELEGARVVAQTSTDLQPDEGHIHVLLDDQLVSMTEGLEQTLRDLAPGLHILKVEFVANDHAPFDPRVIEAVAFEVEA
jgi:hypothetical protein